jgi:predicted Zn-dependent protease
MKSRALVGAVFAACLGLGAIDARPAAACGTAIREVVDNHAMLVSSAEKQLNDGKFDAAAAEVSNAFPGLKLYKPGTGPLADRGLRILAMAVARKNGALTVGAFQGANEKQKAENLEWSITTLRALNVKRPNNPALQTDLGEALSKVEKYQPEAQKLLGTLADKDLLASAEGYAALAKLKASTGDASGRDAALKRCAAMTKTASSVCAMPSAKVSS